MSMKYYHIKGSNTFSQECVGESNYTRNFEQICGKKRTEQSINLIVDVAIIPEPSNPYDPNAFVVKVKDKEVGYLPRQTAKFFRELYDKYKIDNQTALIVKGQIRGGWARNNIKANYGIWLDLPNSSIIEEEVQKLSNNSDPEKLNKRENIKNKTIYKIIFVILLFCFSCLLICLAMIILSPSTQIYNAII